MIVNAAYSVISMLLIIALGFFIGGTEFFKKHDLGGAISIYLKNIGIPVYMFYNAITNFHGREELFELFKTLPYSLMTVGGSFVIGVIVAYALKIKPSRRGTFVNALGFSNTVFLGFPVISAIFGDSVLPKGMILYAANTVIFWTVGVYLLRKEGGGAPKFFTKGNLKQVAAPPLIGFVTGVVVVALGIKLPQFLMTSISYVSGTSSPLGMMFIGTVIRATDLRQGGIIRDVVVLFLTRFILLPIILVGFMRVIPIDLETRRVFYILALMPAMTQLGVMSRVSGGDYKFASVWITVSTILGVGSIPLFTYIMERFII